MAQEQVHPRVPNARLDDPERCGVISAVGPRFALIGICVAFVVLAGVITFKLPPWEANDEPDHAQNVETLRSGHWYRITEKSGLESHQPPLYYLGLAGWAELTGISRNATHPVSRVTVQDMFNNPGLFRHDTPRNAADTSYIRQLRALSILLGLFTILLTYATASLVSMDQWTPIVAAAITAFWPKFVFLSGTVNNDNLANATGALVIFASVFLIIRRPPRPVLWGAAFGGLLGLLVLTKLSTLPLAAGLILALVLYARRGRLALTLTAFIGSAFAVCGGWLISNKVRYGDIFGSKAALDHFTKVFPPLTIDSGYSFHRVFEDLPIHMWKTLWYSSGWNQLSWPTWWYAPFWALFVVGMSAFLWFRPIVRSVSWVLGIFVLGGFAAYWIIGISANTTEARPVLISIAAIATVLALGFERLPAPVWLRFNLPVIGLIGTVIAINNDVLWFYS